MTAPTIMPGIHPNISRVQYDAIQAINQSSLKPLIEYGPADYKYAIEHPEPPTDALRFGQAVHLACYEPARFAIECVEEPKFDRRTKQGKADAEAFEAAAADKLIISAEEYALIGAIQAAVMAHPTASKLIATPGSRECAAVWQDAETGLLCKARMDQLTENRGVIIDLKTTSDCREFALESANHKYGYDIQAAFYADGVAAIVGGEPPAVVLIYVDKTRVEAVGADAVVVQECDPTTIEYGRLRYRRALEQIAECRKTGVWTGWTKGIGIARVPVWALRKENIEQEAFQ